MVGPDGTATLRTSRSVAASISATSFSSGSLTHRWLPSNTMAAGWPARDMVRSTRPVEGLNRTSRACGPSVANAAPSPLAVAVAADAAPRRSSVWVLKSKLPVVLGDVTTPVVAGGPLPVPFDADLLIWSNPTQSSAMASTTTTAQASRRR